jgi:tetratricopeptide (TPR) repeat protein
MHKIFTFLIISSLLVAILSEIPHSYADDAKTLVCKAKGFVWFGRSEDALSYCDKALKIDPNNKEAKELKDNIYNQLEPIRDKLSEADDKLKNDQYNVYWNMQKAILLYTHGQSSEALPYIEKVGLINSDPTTLIFEYVIFIESDENEKALSVVDRLISNPPIDRGESTYSIVDLFNVWKSIALYKLGKYKEANEVLDVNRISSDAKILDPYHPFYPKVFKGLVLEKLGLKDAANQFYQGNSDDLNTEKGVTLFSIGAYGEAISYFEKVPPSSPKYMDVSCMKVAYDEISKSSAIGQFSPSTVSDFFDSLTKFFKNLFHWK